MATKINHPSFFRVAKRLFLGMASAVLGIILFFVILIITKQAPEKIIIKDNSEEECILRVYDKHNKFECIKKNKVFDGCTKGWSKPVLYLYPQTPQSIKVSLDLEGKLTASYPAYDNGWNVIAYPDSKIINSTDQKEYSYLFWDGVSDKEIDYDLSKGFIIEGKNTASFLQDKLSKLGLTPKEYNEFIVYWMPKMQDSKYNLIHFASKEEYDDKAKLTIDPEPDSVLRVFMVFKPLDEKIEVTPQEISPFSRTGFAVIEWGGAEIE